MSNLLAKVILIGAAGALALISWLGIAVRIVRAQPFGEPVYYVTDFGAKCDGATDDLVAFQKARSTLPSTGGVIRLPLGTCMLSGQWAIDQKSNLKIVGAGMDLSTIKYKNSITPNGAVIQVTASSNISISDLTIDGNRDNLTTYSQSNPGIYWQASTGAGPYANFTVERVHIKDTPGDGILVSGSTGSAVAMMRNIFIQHNLIENPKNTGGSDAVPRHGIAIISGEDIHIANNTFRGPSVTGAPGQHAIHLEPDASPTPMTIEKVDISDNTIDNLAGISVNGQSGASLAQEISITGNTIKGHATETRRSGITIGQNSSRVMVKGNVIRMPALASGYSGIDVDIGSLYVVIDANDVTAIGTGSLACIGTIGAVASSDPYQLIVSNNILHSCTGDGLHSYRPATLAIGNYVTTNGGDGIEFNLTSGGNASFAGLVGNVVISNTGVGIKLAATASDYYTIVGNVSRSNTGGNFSDGSTGNTHRELVGNAGVNGYLGGTLQLFGTAFVDLGAPADGTITYCTNCTIANPCAAAGSGALAKRLAGAWVCN